MPYQRPTLSQLRDQALAIINANLRGADARLRFAILNVLAKVDAGARWGQYGYLDYIAQQATPYTATDEFLQAWGALKNVFLKASAVAGAQTPGVVTFTAASGSPPVPAGTPLVRSDGYAFISTAVASVNGSGQVAVPAQAVLPEGETQGSLWNTAVGVSMTLGTSIAGVNSTGTVTTAFTGGTDIETQDEYKARVIQAYSQPPQGGAQPDYVTWALDVLGVTRAWSYPLENGAGTVVVRVMLDDVNAGAGGFPNGTDGVASDETRGNAATGDQLTVANAIFPVRPCTALVYVVAPKANAVAFTISGWSGWSSTIQAAVQSAISAVFLAQGQPGGTVDVSLIETAIAAVSGTAGFVITAITCPHGTVTPGASGNIISSPGYLPTLGAISGS